MKSEISYPLMQPSPQGHPLQEFIMFFSKRKKVDAYSIYRFVLKYY